MRPINFRAWDNETKKIYSVHSFSAHDDGTVELWSFDIDGGYRLTDYVPEQYTGLTDKNGVEIYEGDYIETRKFKNVKVYFDNGSFKVKFRQRENSILIQTLGDFLSKNKSSKIIGNIHENPELLEAD